MTFEQNRKLINMSWFDIYPVVMQIGHNLGDNFNAHI